MTHKLRTLQGQLRSAIQRNATLAAERDAALKSAHSAQCAYYEAVKRSVRVGFDPDAPLRTIVTVRICVDDLKSSKSQHDALLYLNHEVARQAGWKP